MELFPNLTLVRKNKAEVSADEALGDKDVLGLYFSAHWCGPCRGFTPLLKDLYEKAMKASLSFEVIFITSDQSVDAMFDYMNEAHGDWLAVPYGSPVIKELKKKFNLEGIPTLIIIKKDGTVISKDATEDVHSKGPEVVQEWFK